MLSQKLGVQPVQGLCFLLSTDKCLLWFLLDLLFPVQDGGRELLKTKPLKCQTSSVPKVISGTTHFYNERVLDFQTRLTLCFFLSRVLCSDFLLFVSFIALYIQCEMLPPVCCIRGL